MNAMLIIYHSETKVPDFLRATLRQASLVCGTDQLLPIISPVEGITYSNAVAPVTEPDGFLEFKQVFRHLHSTQSYDGVLGWFERYFQIRHFVEKLGIERFCIIDSDVLLYRSVSSLIEIELATRDEVDLAIVPPQEERLFPDTSPIGSGHCLLCKSPAVFSEFCDYATDLFTDPAHLESMYQYTRELDAQSAQGGVCDMYALTRFVESLGSRGGWLTSSENNMNVSNGFEMSGTTKRLRFRKGMPQLQNRADGEWKTVSFLHFQGIAKRFIRTTRIAGALGIESHKRMEQVLGRRFG